MECKNCGGPVIGDNFICDQCRDDNEEIEFTPCSECDGHPACEDFGCAIEAGLRRLLKKEFTIDDL